MDVKIDEAGHQQDERGAEIGADVVTCPLSVITGLLKHPLTDSGLATFLADHAKGSK